jgi:two-component system, NtrC family, sensor kinase
MSSANQTDGEEQAVSSRRAPTSAPKLGTRHSILIADDSKVIRGRLVSILESLEGVELRVAVDGLEALSLARERKPDLLLCDHEMPGLTGIQLLRVLRGTWSRVELPILMLTSNSATETKVLAFQHGANDYVTKPVEPAELCARVNGQLELRRAIFENLAARVQLFEARKYQAVGRLAAGVAHELNNPAQYTSSNLSFLRKSYASMQSVLASTLEWAKGEQHSHPFARRIAEQSRSLRLEEILGEAPMAVEEALDGIRRMAHIIAEMKEFAGDPHGDRVELELNQALRNTVEVSRPMWSRVLSVQLELEPELPSVRGAAHPMKQAFLNVLTNAVEAVASQKRDSCGQLTIHTARVDGGVEVTFSDDGPGIAMDLQDQIFDPFFTTKPLGQGTGQGLFVAYAIIVEQHGGRVRCESQPGKGATFRIWLPIAAAEAAAGG